MRARWWMVVVAALVAPASAADAAFPGGNGKIVYEVDEDCFAENYHLETVNPDGTGAATVPLPPTGVYYNDPAWSPDGARLAYIEDFFVATVKPDGSERQDLGADSFDQAPSWSPDGTKLVFEAETDHQEITTMNADGTGRAGTGQAGFAPVWSPDGSAIAFHRSGEIYTMNPTGANVTNLTNNAVSDASPSWSPDGARIAFSTNRDGNVEIYTMKRDGTDPVRVTTSSLAELSPAWSPDGNWIAFERDRRIWKIGVDGTGEQAVSPASIDCHRDPDWQPIPVNAYPRPRGASPMYIPLVPAYEACTSPNRTHGAPLAFASCAPPVQESPQLTLGTPDANGAAAKSVAAVVVSAKGGNPSTPADEADVRFNLSVTDVREAVGLGDYSGDLVARPVLRITDRDNTPHPGGPGPATVVDVAISFQVPCTTNADPGIGSSCAVMTTADTVAPGAVKEGRRSIWEIDGFEVGDGEAPFLRQGLFVP